MKSHSLLSLGFLAAIVFLPSCAQVDAPPSRHRLYTSLHTPPEHNLNRSCPDRYDADWDYFPDKLDFQYSTQLRVTYHRSYKIVDFVPSMQNNVPLRYVLYQCGTPRPSGFEGATFIQIPLQRAVLNSPSLGSSAAALGVIDRLYGVNDLDQFTNEEILRAGKEGRILALGTRGPSSIELATTIDTDAVFLFYSANPALNIHPALYKLGVGAVALGDLFEANPLGHAEWMKFFALFFNEEARANALFEATAKRYASLRELASRAARTDSVMVGYAWDRDVWTANGGGHFLPQFVRDAGAQYFLQNDTRPAANVRMSFEKAMDLSSRSVFWICGNGLNRVRSKRELIRKIPMMENLFPVHSGRVFALDSNRSRGEAIPYVDSSLDKPDVLLADFISVLHPDLLPGYKPVFIRELL
jgi:iron complex transport system substrate-binding protein